MTRGAPDEAPDPEGILLRMLGGKWLAASISAAASLGLIDALVGNPLSLEDLAARIDCRPEALRRLMRVLAGEGIVRLNADQAYEVTELGALLRRGELGDLARFVGAPFGWDPWSGLADSVRTGRSAFEARHGQGLFDYLDDRGDEAALYHEAIDAFCRREARALASAFDFSRASRVLDVGGGQGTLLIEVLSAWKHLTGMLLERPTAVERATLAFSEAGLADRCEARSGDFFESIPSGADVCVLKHIIHSWDDETAIALMRRCIESVGPDGVLLLIEGLLLPEGHQNMTNLLDLEMLVLCGPGHERTKPQMRRLISAAGLRIVESAPLAAGTRLFVTRRRDA